MKQIAALEKKYRVAVPDDETKSLDELGSIVKILTKYWPHE